MPTNQKAYRNQRVAEARRFIHQAKVDRDCVDCGGAFPPYVLDFDHIHGEKRRNVSQMLTWSLEAIRQEIDKCELVCANCHRERTHQRAMTEV